MGVPLFYIVLVQRLFLTVGVWMSAVAYGRNARLGGGGLASPFGVLQVASGVSVFGVFSRALF